MKRGVEIMSESLNKITFTCARCPAEIKILKDSWYKDQVTGENICRHCFNQEELDHQYREVTDAVAPQ